MTDPKSSAEELPSLLEERRRYEEWLAALDARRDSTAPHVFDRVRSDYDGRLRQVNEKLNAHRHAIQEEKTSLESRRALLEAEEQLRRDERTELELRAHVGELTGRDAELAFGAVDETLEKLLGENQELASRIRQLDALLENRPPQAEATRAEATRVAPDVAPSPEVLAPKEETESLHDAMTADPSIAKAPALQTPGGSFDELAFLSTVVNEDEHSLVPPPTVAAEVAKDESVSESLLSDLAKPAERRPVEAPFGANVPANTPIVLRTSGAIEQSKTLKCSECGAMNYPTEWYCERCGAELAAL